jgi:hypothetical protein
MRPEVVAAELADPITIVDRQRRDLPRRLREARRDGRAGPLGCRAAEGVRTQLGRSKE